MKSGLSHLFLADLSAPRRIAVAGGWKNTAVTPPSDIQFPPRHGVPHTERGEEEPHDKRELVVDACPCLSVCGLSVFINSDIASVTREHLGAISRCFRQMMLEKVLVFPGGVHFRSSCLQHLLVHF